MIIVLRYPYHQFTIDITELEQLSCLNLINQFYDTTTLPDTTEYQVTLKYIYIAYILLQLNNSKDFFQKKSVYMFQLIWKIIKSINITDQMLQKLKMY